VEHTGTASNGSPVAGNRQWEAYSRLLDGLLADAPRIAQRVADDLGDEQASDELEAAVGRFLAGLARGTRLPGPDLARLRREGAAAARAGIPLARPIDEALSTAWVCWSEATALARGAERDALDLLGAALLRAGDDTAAALADGYTAVERALAARGGATRRGVLDELLAPRGTTPGSQARRQKRAALVGLDPAARYRVMIVRGEVELEDEGPEARELDGTFARDARRRPYLVAVRDGDLVVVVGEPVPRPDELGRHLDPIGLDSRWWASISEPTGLADLAVAYGEALDGLRVARALRLARTLVPAARLALERALVADPVLARSGVDEWLGPLERAPRGGRHLIGTLEAFFDEGGSVTATARRLEVAPRTVSYRLARVARLLGVSSLDGEVRARLVTALLARQLLAGALLA
jgi:hypothetical protein